jgi:hypothetical protein
MYTNKKRYLKINQPTKHSPKIRKAVKQMNFGDEVETFQSTLKKKNNSQTWEINPITKNTRITKC